MGAGIGPVLERPSRRRWPDPSLALVGTTFWVVLAFIVVPLGVLAAVSVHPGRFMTFPPQGFSLRWYQTLLTSSQWLEAIRNSLVVALGSAVLATSIALVLALVLDRYPVRFGEYMRRLGMMPLFLPPVIMGVAFVAFFYEIGFSGRIENLIIAHGIFNAPFPLLLISSGLSKVNRELEESAMNLGARPATVLRTVTLPLIRADVFAGVLFAFLLSLNEYIVAFLVSGFTVVTLPIEIFSSLRYSFSPVIAAASVLFIAGTGFLVWLADRLAGGLWD